MDQVARIRFNDGVFLMPAYGTHAADVALAQAEDYARRYGHVTAEVNGRRLLVRVIGNGKCWRCAQPATVVFATSQSSDLCGHCTRELIHLG
jgi:hypothetical protein